MDRWVHSEWHRNTADWENYVDKALTATLTACKIPFTDVPDDTGGDPYKTVRIDRNEPDYNNGEEDDNDER
jgi:hypothetical protein